MPGDLDKLQGTWTVTSLDADGAKMPRTALGDARIVITDNRFVSLGMGAEYEGTVEIDQTRSPKSLDLIFTGGHARGTRNLGIYRLSGDRWTICLATRGTTRPKTFATRAGTGLALETLQRGEPKPATTRAAGAGKASAAKGADRGRGPATQLEGEWAMASAVFDGQPMDEAMVKWCKRVTAGDVTTVLAGPQTMLKARFTLDERQRPGRIDYVNLHGSNKGRTQAGIFAIDRGVLKICMAAPGQPRPAEFASRTGDGRSFTTWRASK